MKAIRIFFEYYEVFAEYLNPVAVVTSGILYALLFAFVLLVALILLRKYILVQRKYSLMKYIAWSYFLLLPLIGGFFGFQWGVLHSMHHQFQDNITAKAQEATANISTSWEGYIAQALTTGVQGNVPEIKYSSNDVINLATEVLYLRYQSYIDSITYTDDNLAIKALGYLNHLTDGKVLAYGVKKGIHSLLEKTLALDKETSEELLATRLDELIKGGVLVKIIQIQIDRVFKPFKFSVFITLLFILALPILEIGIAHYWLRKQQAIKE